MGPFNSSEIKRRNRVDDPDTPDMLISGVGFPLSTGNDLVVRGLEASSGAMLGLAVCASGAGVTFSLGIQ